MLFYILTQSKAVVNAVMDNFLAMLGIMLIAFGLSEIIYWLIKNIKER